MWAAIINLVPLAVGIAIAVIWIISLAKWDGKCHCNPEDCEDCPYSGTGCKNDTNKNRKDKQS